MGEVVSRVNTGEALSTPSTGNTESPQKAPQTAISSANPAEILRLVVNNTARPNTVETWVPKMNRVAREQLFRSLVSDTLDNPKHPYYSLVSPAMRQDMIETITLTLTDSHYFA